MREELFAELLESVRQGGAILRGQLKPSRAYRFEELDVRAVREGYGLSQSKFAALMGISPATLRNWEQGPSKARGQRPRPSSGSSPASRGSLGGRERGV